ncbi:MAG: DUF4369 domain-containing protein [Bacteroidetes bacterium]|nr:MAG: DUF4369 domain-containing protein [Bacteroidota bacterium]
MKSFIITLLLISTTMVAYSQNEFEIFGDVKGLDNQKILLLKTVGASFEMEMVEVENEKFHIKGEISEPYWVQLIKIKDGTESETEGKLTEFILEASKIYVVGCSKEYEDVKVYGSESDRVLKEYFEEDERLNSKWFKLKEQKEKYEQQGDEHNAGVIKEQMNKIAKVDKVELLKKYVKENRDNIIGALIPNFCTIDNLLTEEDYQEIYQTLTEEIRETDFGKSILERSKKQ